MGSHLNKVWQRWTLRRRGVEVYKSESASGYEGQNGGQFHFPFSWNNEINKEYGKLLRSDFAASVCQVTTANSSAKSAQSITTNMKKVELNKPVEAKKSTTTKTSSGSQIKTKKLLLKETFMCTVAEVYNVRNSSMFPSDSFFRFLSTNKESMLGLVERCNLIM